MLRKYAWQHFLRITAKKVIILDGMGKKTAEGRQVEVKELVVSNKMPIFAESFNYSTG